MSEIENDYDFKDIFSYPAKIIKIKFKSKIKLLRRMNETAHMVPTTQLMFDFIHDLILWLENSIVWAFNPFANEKQVKVRTFIKKKPAYLFNETALLSDFKITDEGDIFRKDVHKNSQEQLTHWFTNENALIEARFAHGIARNGKALIYYPNAEFFDGSIKGI